MEVAAAIDAMLALAASPARQDRVLEMRAAFEARTGSFSPRESFFEARSAAFWDDALTRGSFAREIADELPVEARAFVEPFARAHRGLFRVEPEERRFLLVDEWSGAEFSAEPGAPGLRDALERASGLVDARVVGFAEGETTRAKTLGFAERETTRATTLGAFGRITVLPGAVFHHADALEPMLALLPIARARDLATHDVLDALLRMDHAFRTLSRVKPAFAYRKEAL